MENVQKKPGEIPNLMLTLEEIENEECCRHLTTDQKLELILFVFEISLALYHSFTGGDEQQ